MTDILFTVFSKGPLDYKKKINSAYKISHSGSLLSLALVGLSLFLTLNSKLRHSPEHSRHFTSQINITLNLSMWHCHVSSSEDGS